MRDIDTMPMVSRKDALAWAERQPDSTVKPMAVKRIRYEFERREPMPAKYHKGIYGHKYDTYTCGACGAEIVVGYRYCASCGREIDWRRT